MTGKNELDKVQAKQIIMSGFVRLLPGVKDIKKKEAMTTGWMKKREKVFSRTELEGRRKLFSFGDEDVGIARVGNNRRVETGWK